MVDEIKEKKSLIKSIKNDLEDIEYWRDNFIFEEELEFSDVAEIDNLIGKVWLKYYSLYKKIQK